MTAPTIVRIDRTTIRLGDTISLHPGERILTVVPRVDAEGSHFGLIDVYVQLPVDIRKETATTSPSTPICAECGELVEWLELWQVVVPGGLRVGHRACVSPAQNEGGAS